MEATQVNVPHETSLSYEQALERAASIYGIDLEYWDIWGNPHSTSPEALNRILGSLGVNTSSVESIEADVERRLWSEWSKPLGSVAVVGHDRVIEVSVPESNANADLRFFVRLESGSEESVQLALADAPVTERAELRGGNFVRKQVRLPESIPIGYHDAVFDGGDPVRLIVSPEHGWIPASLAAGGRAAGISVSLYGLRSKRNWGCGDFTDLRALIDWAADDAGVSAIGLNPLHALPNRQPFNTSPYLPNCAFYRNPIYLDVEAVPDFVNASQLRCMARARKMLDEIAALRDSEYVQYERVYALKLRFLRLAFRRFLGEIKANSPRAREFRTWTDTEGEPLDGFATYCALDEVIHKENPDVWVWPQWPDKYRDPASPAVAEFKRRYHHRVLFHKYLQWLVDQQLGEAERYARDKGLAIGLYHDLALATDSCGSDLWAHRSFYVSGCRVGAPPDGFSPKGQDWGFPPPNSWKHRETGYRLIVESIRKNCRHGGALRIDHVMRFFRLYWIPDGMEALHGTYVKEFWQDLLKILALESVRNQVMIVGEDLGTVEPSFREALAEHGILSYRLLYFEKSESGEFLPPAEYPRQALISATTHDLPTLAGFWAGQDVEARQKANLFPNDDVYREALRERAVEKQRLLDTLVKLGFMPPEMPNSASEIPELTGELHNAVVGFLASSPCMLMVLNQEDLFKETDQQNLPGTTAEYPNWSHKMAFRLEELRTNPFARDCTAMLSSWLEKTGRANSAQSA